MRDCIFLLADKNMEAAFTGFFTRKQFHESLGIRQFDFDPQQDIIVEAGSDPGVYNRAHELIRPYQRTHRYAVVVLDNAWDGSPGVKKIHNNIMNNLTKTGWEEENCAVIVIDPELEIWILQGNHHVEKVFQFKQDISLRQWLEQKGLWDASVLKPADPKKAVEEALKCSRTPRSSAIYQKITSKVSVSGCTDTAFKMLCNKMQQWFSVEECKE
ncbi:hypothetical protein [Coleofasciculus sp. FACHB-129]|uniref:methylation-associated defense system protein MAD4 n=1 Tax=Cyanophyceae TaxID=3028117 RepID=UPI0016864A74|nr:hypothetical protein [Coleofasciculus sp. FACHB-129]MBD1897909.1 hypothetical protein [Coleofasciculus sp. FACHB-129]